MKWRSGVLDHKLVLESRQRRDTGWWIDNKDAANDRLAILAGAIGEDDARIAVFQERAAQYLVQAYRLPTQAARYDTTSFNAYQAPSSGQQDLMRFGHSRNHRPDLLQSKQGLATLGPVGIPLCSETLPGHDADERPI